MCVCNGEMSFSCGLKVGIDDVDHFGVVLKVRGNKQ